ncbi:MAG TPA: serine/threonine-protein kinase [Polyangiales bacterium]|nr:serine/threonine-protein kinase [Polyangiales bacterium]
MARTRGATTAMEERLIAGRYRVETLLGKGGMGAVYAAVDTTTGKRLALKTTSANASAKVLELFKREFHTLHGLRHPNIIEVYDYGRDQDSFFYTMELLEGRDLGGAAPLPWREVCSYLRQVATLLGLLHARRLLHRDVTPRNLWVLPDGRLKLIDFGALCPFGVPTEVVGTPPFLAPEWLYDRTAGIRVDQRADLFALGALGYWLLTSVHAYPARAIHDLQRVWAREPAPPSSLAKLVESRALETIPPELDALVLSLLRREPAARPETTEALIDGIDAIAGPPVERVDHAVHGYVRSKVFVGRRDEQREIVDLLSAGAGAAVVIEAPAGLGRSRLLEELSVVGRLSGAASILVRGGAGGRAYAAANDLALALLTAAPQEAKAAAQDHAPVLAQLSREVAERLGVSGNVTRETSPLGRARLSHALTEWLFSVAAMRRVLLLVDDIESCDEESAAWLAALAPYCRSRGLLLVAALCVTPGAEPALHLQMLRNAARRIPLWPLSAAETRELLQSVFGPATYLERVADVLHRVSEGSPTHCLDLVEHIVDRGLARYSEGTWILPGQLADAELPRSASQVHLARLDDLDDDARQLARGMSVHAGPLTRADCQAIWEANAHDTEAALVALTLHGVLVEAADGWAFDDASVRDELHSELSPEARSRAHAKLGAALLARATDPVDRLQAALHLFEAGEHARAEPLVREAALHCMLERSRLHVAVPMFERAVQLYRAAGRAPEVLAAPLGALASASFFVDRRLAMRHGRDALDALERALRFDIARKLSRFVGVRLALPAAISAAVIAQKRIGPGALRVPNAIRMLVGSAIALNGVATSSIDVEMQKRCEYALEPLAGFGDENIVGLVRRSCTAFGAMLGERPAAAYAQSDALRAWLESDRPIRGLTPAMRTEFLGGSLLTLGLMESWRQSDRALEIADRIEPLGPMYAVNADQLRSMHWSCRGDLTRAAFFSQRIETRALQAGAAWQIVALGPIGMSFNALWNHDALLAKRAAAELERLSGELRSFRHEARRARALYLVLTARYPEAIELMQASDEQPGSAGWSRSVAILARAYNRIGEHARARELCRDALHGKSEEDLTFVQTNLHVQLELALADAALGDFAVARERSEKLLAKHGRLGPVALGTLHEVRARIALLERDFEAGRTHCAAMRSCFGQTEIATLRELAERLSERLRAAEHGEATALASPAALLADDAHLMTRVHLILTHTEATFERRAQLALRIALDLTGAESGFVLATGGAGNVVSAGDPPSAELVAWAEAQLAGGGADQTAIASPDRTLDESAVLTRGTTRYCAVPLAAAGAGDVAAGLVLGFRGVAPRAPNPDVLAILGGHLVATQSST